MFRDVIKPIHLIMASAVLAAIVIATVLVKLYEGANPIVIKRVPSDAKIFVNDKQINGGRTALANGSYTVRAERDGFDTATYTAVINDDNKYIAVALTPNTDTTRKWAEKNEVAYLDLERFVESSSKNSGMSLASANPIVKNLPLSGDVYDVGYISDSKDPSGNSIILTVHAVSGFRNAAIRGIYDAGYNPAEYTISFDNFTSPFSEGNNE